MVVALAAAGLALVSLGEATDQRAGAQQAADAAALAGAVHSRDDLVAAVSNPVVAAAFTGAWGRLDGYVTGTCGAAGAYATANDAALTACARAGGRTSVAVRSAGGGQGLRATASAVADHQAPVCALVPPDDAPPDDGGAGEGTGPGEGAVAATRLLVCRGHGAQAFVETDPATGEVVAASPPAQWRKTFTVRLVE